MKVTYSPIIAGLSGKAADVVAARWKGVPYVRSHVIPANPRTAAQIAQRNKNTYKVWFAQQWNAKWKEAWTEFVAGRALSEMNGFSSFNKLDPFGASGLLASPFNVDVANPSDLLWQAGVASKSVKLTWTDPSIVGSYLLWAVILEIANPGTKMDRDDWPAAIDFQVGEELASGEIIEIEMGQASQPYQCYAAMYDPTAMAKKAIGKKGVAKTYFLQVQSTA